MLNRSLAAIRKHLPLLGDARRARRWANRTFDDFVVTDGDRRTMLATIADHALRLIRMANDPGTQPALPETLLQVCSWIDSGRIRLAGAEIRSYEDISIQVATLRRLIDYLVAEAAMPGDASTVAALLVERFPDSRPALLVRAEQLMEQSLLDEAI